jgi:hypothetical protein
MVAASTASPSTIMVNSPNRSVMCSGWKVVTRARSAQIGTSNSPTASASPT